MSNTSNRLSRRDFFRGKFIADAFTPAPPPTITDEEIDALEQEAQALEQRAQKHVQTAERASEEGTPEIDPELVQQLKDLTHKLQEQLVAAQGQQQISRLGKIKDMIVTGAIGTLLVKTGEDLYGAFIETEVYPMLKDLTGELLNIYQEVADFLQEQRPQGVHAAPEPQRIPQPSPSRAPSTRSTPIPQGTRAQRDQLGLDWIYIPAGEFLMGSNDYDGEKPPHTVVLPTYRIAKTPVTVAQFAHFVKATGYTTTAEKEGSAWGWTGSKWEDIQGAYWARPRGPKSNVEQKAEHPVTCVSWHDAMAFCKWANVRLPTEAEWEKAARGTDGRTFPWGEDEPDKSRCNFNMNEGDTTPVGSYASGASPYGCLDMAGNVWEWTSSLWGNDWQKPDFGYPYDAGDGREHLEASDEVRRVLRGGAFNYFRLFVRCANRDGYNPRLRDNDVGFRVVAPGF